MRSKLRVALLTGLDNSFISKLISNIKEIEEVTFSDVIYWKPNRNKLQSLKRNLKKHGIIYLLWRPLPLLNEVLWVKISRLFQRLLYVTSIQENLISTCSKLDITIHDIENLHSDKGVLLVKSLNCDLLLICGTGIIRKSIFTIPPKGTLNLHQGEVSKYRGAPPGFWELWNDEKQAGVTIHFVDEGIDTGDVVLQKIIPIFEYDTLGTLQAKLSEISLTLYPLAVKKIANENYKRIKQIQHGKQYYFPTISQKLRLNFKISKNHFELFTCLRRLLRDTVYLVTLIFIFLRKLLLTDQGRGTLVVLYYHRVTDICQDGMTIGIADFEKQIRFLKKHYHMFSSSELIESLTQGGVIKGMNNCLITFDDGYDDNYRNALPILQKYGCPAIFLVSTGLIGNDAQFAHDQQIQPELTFEKMTWEQLHDSLNLKIGVGIHSHSHANLGKLDRLEAIDEVETSIHTYEKHLHKKPLFMSYPFGKKSDITDEIKLHIAEHTQLAALFSAYGGINRSPLEKYDIRRINIGKGDNGLAFLIKLHGGFQAIFGHQ